MKRALIVWGNWGPYHHARLDAFRRLGAAHSLDIQGLQLFAGSGHYDWQGNEEAEGLHHLDLGHNESRFRPRLLTSRVAPWILRFRPDVVFVPSYWHWSLFLNLASRAAGARIVMMNDSHAGTESVRGVRRRLKRVIVRSFHAALVAGNPHRRFFAACGLRADRIFTGYDAVDNARFQRAAMAAREEAAHHRARLGLPPQYFLSLGRFVEKKNLPMLVRAFAALRPAPGGSPHHLVFVGSGETQSAVRAQCARLSLPTVDHVAGRDAESSAPAGRAAVHFYGFRQITENPVFYALATAFVLPSQKDEWGLVVNEAMACRLPVLVSSGAGCAEDLVAPGVNGFVFAPDDDAVLTRALQHLADDPALVGRMGAASAERIQHWSCENFAVSALAAAEAALAR